MKRFFFILILTIGLLSFSQAQEIGTHTPEALAARVTGHVGKVLKLVGTQRKQFYDLQLGFMQARQAIIQKQTTADGSSQPARLQLYNLRKENEFNVKQLLSAEQALLYDAYLAEQKPRK